MSLCKPLRTQGGRGDQGVPLFYRITPQDFLDNFYELQKSTTQCKLVVDKRREIVHNTTIRYLKDTLSKP